MNTDPVILNEFQKRLEERLNAALKNLGLQVDSRRVGREEVFSRQRSDEAVVVVKAQQLGVRIREDSVSFEISGKGDYYEMPDYANADALADTFLAVLTERWHKRPGT